MVLIDILGNLTKKITSIHPSGIHDPSIRSINNEHEQDDGLHDLARKFNITLEAIALQTRHIVDEMNAKGHTITSIYMSGGQAKNIPLMELFANTCNMPVILPKSSGAAVVLGAAMLGRFAAQAQALGFVKDQGNGKWDIKGQCEALWNIMVSF